MFTGLVADIGTVVDIAHKGRASRLKIATNFDLSDGEIGESIAVDGACYTVVAFDKGSFSVDISPESLDRTTSGALRRGDRVHLERALRLADRLGGHLMLGHVDAVGKLERRTPEANAWHLWFSAPKEVTPYLIPKGSIAVNGVSLTINECSDAGFSVTIIPHTTEKTLLGEISVGSRVNLEADVIGKYVVSAVERFGGGGARKSLADLLQDRGFINAAD